MKRQIARGLLLALLTGCLLAGFASCKKEQKEVFSSQAMKQYTSDAAYIHDKRALIVGVTDYRPLDFQVDGQWTGFDAELARKFAQSLDLQIFFKEIDWEKKTALLDEGVIDCIWNGMTRTDELVRAVACSRPYLVNSQVIVLPKEEVGLYKHESACSHLLFTVESGSSAENLLKKLNWRYITTKTQSESLELVKQGRADAAVIDSIMASALDSEALGFSLRLNYDLMSVALRANSDLLDRLNQFLQQSEVDGTIGRLKEKYGIK